MSFRIDIARKDGVIVTLVVVRNSINFLFDSNNDSVSTEQSYATRNDFSKLLRNIPLEHYKQPVRGEDPEHIKRHHGYSGEVNIPHQHIGFDRDVTPAMLAPLLNGIIRNQADLSDERFQFIDQETVDEVSRTFAKFHLDFTGSKLQQQFLEERQLTESEKQSLVRDAKKLSSGVLSASDKKELELCGIDTSNITPKPEAVPLERLLRLMFLNNISSINSMLSEENDDEENNEIGCPIQ